jgi:aminotransferase
MKISKLVQQIQPSGIRAFFDLVLGMKDVISLGVGEPDFEPPAFVLQAAKDAIDAGCSKYTAVTGIAPLKKAIADDCLRRRGHRPHVRL